VVIAGGLAACKMDKSELGLENQGEISAGIKGKPLQVGSFIYQIGQPKFLKVAGGDQPGESGDAIYLVIPAEVKNAGSTPRLLDTSFFRLIDPIGRECRPLTMITPSPGDTLKAIFQTECEPDYPSSGVLIFDVQSETPSYTLKVSGGSWKGRTAGVAIN
jgi:hypothetical protein